MILIKVQKNKPARTCTKTYAHYRSFKPYLRTDFNERCGYCDDLDLYSGGVRGFHIDHFKPHSISRFSALKETYSNLVYSCSYCNGAKSNKWKDINGFIEPCENEYDNHIYRTKKGQIKYKSEQGKYLYNNLKLGLKRHELLWCIDKLKIQSEIISKKIESIDEGHELELTLLRSFKKIQDSIQRYTEFFRDSI